MIVSDCSPVTSNSPYNVRQLRLRNQILSLGPNELLLQHHQFSTLRLLHLELLNLVGNLALRVSAGLYALLRVTNRLEYAPRVVQRMRISVLLLTHLAHDHAHLVREVADGIIAGLLAPLRELGGDGVTLAAGGLVGRNEVVLGLDEAEEAAGELGLDGAAEGTEGEAWFAGGRTTSAAARGAERASAMAPGWYVSRVVWLGRCPSSKDRGGS